MRVHCCHRTEYVEEHRIGRNLKVEIDEAVYQNSADAKKSSQCYRSIHVRRPRARFANGRAQSRNQKPYTYREPRQSSFGQQFQIVVMCPIDGLVGVEASELRIHISKAIQSPSGNWTLCEHA